MSDQLPPEVEEIQKAERNRPTRGDNTVYYSVEFVYGETHVAEFAALQPIREPCVGEVLGLHQVPVRVISVGSSYDTNDETGQICVSLTVEITPEPRDG